MNKRCKLGKSCGASCISRIKVCLLDLKGAVSSGIGKLKGMLGGGGSGEEKPKESAKAITPSVTPKDKKIKEENAQKVEDAFKGDKGKKLFVGMHNDLKEPLKGELSPDEIKEMAASHYRESREFMRRLSDGLPPGTKMDISEYGKVKLSMKTKTGDKVEVKYSPKSGFHFSVNGSHDAGTVKSKEGQLQVTLAVRNLFRSTIAALPEGSSLFTMAYEGDGKGGKRQEIYGKLGFNKPDSDGLMFGRVGSSRRSLTPTDRNTWADQARTRNAVLFSEVSVNHEESDEGLGSIEDWYQIVFGVPMTQSQEQS
jgi:hypothetical protein